MFNKSEIEKIYETVICEHDTTLIDSFEYQSIRRKCDSKEDKLKEITTIYRYDNVSLRDDPEVIKVVEEVHFARTAGGYGLEVFNDDLQSKLGGN